jgi:hypothetical protein
MDGWPPLELDRERDGLALLRAVAEQRRSARSELRLPEQERLSDRERIGGRRAAELVLREIEDRMRARLAAHFEDVGALHGSLASARVPIAWPILERTGVWRDEELIACCLASAQDPDPSDNGGTRTRTLLTRLVADPSEAIAAHAMGLLVAASRHLDDEPSADGLPAELVHRLTWQVAAALRTYIVAQHDVSPARADEAIAQEATALLTSHDEASGVEALAQRLARELDRAERAEDALQALATVDRRTGLFGALLAVRTRLLPEAVRDLLADRADRGLVLLLRAAGVERATTASILSERGYSSNAERLLATFDGLSEEEALASLAPWRADPLYRSALVRTARQP